MIYFFLFGLVLLCVLSTGAGSLRSFSRHKLEDLCRRRTSQRRFDWILKRYHRVATAVGMVRLLCSTLLLLGFCFWMTGRNEPLPVRDWIAAAVFVPPAYLLVEFWIARAVAKLWGTQITFYLWPFWNFLAVLIRPLTVVDGFFSLIFHRLAGRSDEPDDEEAFEEEIRTMVTEGHREGLLEEDAREMIEGVIELSDFTVSEIMTPRTDMISIPDTFSWEEMLCVIISTPHSRIPVYKENRDDIVGMIHAKDLLRELAVNDPPKRRPWTDLMKEPLFVPETKPVDTLLQEFQNTKPATGSGDNASPGAEEDNVQRSKGHLAIVLDEYGGVSGIVTLEDILEEIVGEILDEHDPLLETEEIREIDPNTYESLGKVRIDELNETLRLDLPEEEDYDTIAGFIFTTLGHVPDIGERVEYMHEGNRIRFTVLEATRRRIEKVRIERNPSSED